MSKLYFRVEAEYEKVIRLREECKKLEEQLKNMDSTSSPASVRRLETQLSEARSEMSGLTSEAAKAGAQMEHGFKSKIYEASKAVNNLSDKIIGQRAAVRKASDEAKRLGEAYRDALKTRPADADGLLERYRAAKMSLQGERDALFKLTQEQAHARLSVKKLRDEYNLYKKDSVDVKIKNNDVADSFGKMSLSMGKVIGIIGGTAALKELATQIVRVRGEFQEMETSIETMVGKNMAGKLIPQIKELAKISPLTMSDMVGAEKMMLGFNIAAEDTIKYLKAMSDLSMGSSAKFNSLTLAFSQMSAAGKLMGQDLNQMINAGFNPLQQIAQRTGKSIAQLKDEMSKGAISAKMVQDAFISATSEGGKFFKMSENASKTINGQISMMEDATDAMFNEIGKASEGFIVNTISGVTSLIENYETVGKVLVGLIATYGTYKAALIAVIAVEKARLQFALASMQNLTKMQAITEILTAKTKGLFKMLSLNPYAAAAAAVVGLVAAMWALHDSTSAAEKAQKNYNDELERFQKKEDERKAKIESLIRVIQDKNETEYAQVKAYEELKRLSPDLTAAYKREELAVAQLTDAQKELNKERDKHEYDNIVSNVKAAKKAIEDTQKQLEQLIKTPGNHVQELQMLGRSHEIAKEELKKWEDALHKMEELKEKVREESKPVSVRLLEAKSDLNQIEDEFKKAKEKLDSEQKKLAENPLHVIPFHVQIQYDTAKQKLEGQQKKITTLTDLNKEEEEKNYKRAYDNAKALWEKTKKELKEVENDKARFATEVYKKRKQAYETAESQFKALGGDVTGKHSKEAKKEAKALEQGNERVLKARRKNQADEIALMKEGRAKRMAQIKLDYQTREDEIKRLEEQEAKNNKEAGKKAVNANGLTNEQQAEIDKARKLNNEKRVKAEFDVLKAEKDAMNQYLEEYGSMQQKKLAIAESYAEKIAKATTKGEKMILEAERKAKISGLEMDSFFDSIDWATAFGGLGSMFSDVIEPVLNQLKQFVNTDKFKGMGADKQKAVVEAMKQMEESVISTSVSLKDLAPQIERFKDSVYELSNAEGAQRLASANLEKAQERYADAMKNGTKAEKESAEAGLHLAQMNAKAADETLETARKNTKETQQQVRNTSLILQSSMQKIEGGLSKLSSGSLKGIWDGVMEASTGLAERFSGKMGQAFGKLAKKMEKVPIVGWVLSILDVFKDGITHVLTGVIDTVFSALNNIVKDIFSLDAFKGVFNSLVKGVGNFWNTITFGVFHKEGNSKEVKETIDRLTERNNALIQSLDDLRDTVEKVNGSKAIDAYTKAVAYQKELNKNLMEIAKAQGRYHNAHGSWNHYFDFTPEDIRWIQQNIKKDFFGDDDLWTLTPEQMKQLRSNADIWNRMLEGGKGGYGQRVIDKLNDYIDQAGKLDELTDSVKESITGIDFESFKEGFTDALLDMESTAEDFSENFEKQLQNAVFRALIDNEFSDDIKKLYEDWYKAAKDGLNESEEGEAGKLREEMDKLIDEMLARREELKKEFGWDSEEEQTELGEIKGLSDLQRAYSKLSEAVSKVYSSERVKAIQDQNKNLAEQKKLIEERIAVEKDADSLKDYQNQLEDINAQIEANKEAMKDAIFGADIQSAINDFVNAYTNALGNGDTSDVAADFVQNMIRGMVVEAMKADASPVVAAVRAKLIEAWKDGVISSEEQSAIEDLITQLNKEFEEKYEWADDLFKKPEEEEKQTSEIEGLKELQQAYRDLASEMDKAYSTERVKKIEEQISLLEQQKSLLQSNIAKGGDASIIEGWEDQLHDIEQSIADAKESQIDAIFGSDIQSAVSSFADALIDAWARGEDKAKSTQQVVKNIIRGMVAESMKMDLSPQVDELRKKLAEMYKDGVITADENSVITELVKGMTESLEEQYKWADEFLKDEKEEVQETVEEIEETFSNMTFESMRDDFVSQLADMETSYEDMCNSFEDKLKQSIIKGFLESKYKSQIQRLISTWDAYGDSNNIDENELENLREQYKEIIGGMIQDRDEIAEKMGWEKFQQGATGKGFAAMSQDTGDELNGRFTAMYESDLRREKIQSEQLAVMRAMAVGKGVQTPITELTGPVDRLLESGAKMYTLADDTRTILANSYVELQQIRENTGAIVKPIKQMQKDIEQVKRNTERL